MTNIGIVGAGVAGLQLGLFLRQHQIETTIYAERTPAELLGSQLPSLVSRFDHTRQRERLLGVNHWDGAANDSTRFHIDILGEQPIGFDGQLTDPMITVDMRIYGARLLEDYIAHGGRVAYGVLQADDVERLSTEHDLMVVASGRGSLGAMFPRLPESSPYDRPQRLITAGLFRGVAYPQPVQANMIIVPGQGEILVLPIYSFEPNLTGLAFEAVPGGAFETIYTMRYQDDPRRFETTMLDLLREYAPTIADRIDPQAFKLARSLDLLQGAITPTVRRSYVQLKSGKFALALGDTHVLNDPILGQGANTASHSAWQVGEAIRAGQLYDEAFCQQLEQRMWDYARPVTEWNNAMLQPPPPHVIEFMVAAAQNPQIANVFSNFFNNPRRGWEVFSNPANTAALLRQHGWQGMPAPAHAA
jgi:2-polyprenyl-6-methoxyphenol hydroxylase-like FAD-dependent oxidoreductase